MTTLGSRTSKPTTTRQAETLVGFWQRAQDWFWAKGMTVDEVMSDNGSNFRSRVFADVLAERAIKHRRTRPYRPQSNGKVERFNRTLADEFLYSFTFRSENERRRRLDRWVHDYNHHRNHTAVGGPPASRVHNVCGSELGGLGWEAGQATRSAQSSMLSAGFTELDDGGDGAQVLRQIVNALVGDVRRQQIATRHTQHRDRGSSQ